MTVINQSRVALDAALNEPTNTLFLLFETADGLARSLHDRAARGARFRNRQAFLFTDRSVLTPAELAVWPAADDEFVIWSCSANTGFFDRLDTLLLTDGITPSILLIRKAFIDGERL